MVGIFGGMIDERAIRERYETIRDQLDERGRRLFAAAKARSVGRGGVMAVCRATGLARSTIEGRRASIGSSHRHQDDPLSPVQVKAAPDTAGRYSDMRHPWPASS